MTAAVLPAFAGLAVEVAAHGPADSALLFMGRLYGVAAVVFVLFSILACRR